MSSRPLAFVAVVVLALLNAWIDVLHVRATHRAASKRSPPLSHYTFVDEDLPPLMPVPAAERAVLLLPEDSQRYPLWAPQATQEWMFTATAGDGNVHFGANRRMLVVAESHMLHCLRSVRTALAQDAPPSAGGHQMGHLAHCVNFIRQSVLCSADATLEPPDAFARNYTREPAGNGAHVCKDFDAFYGEMKGNYLAWTAYQKGLAAQEAVAEETVLPAEHHHRDW
ncbi:uncharacterized protein BXZ73DRAFT_92588 [Epithele typhae]|uniref:uncharacterized protein n=1 Tax=Epithele typhae TaxID=378194 RepID=UPI002008AB57|nr:uncharacterized protein BXZ73DRAFT_92588 [Epithele typhae]KAH9915554.1 hypothetical protein BXZ73DRAFT_92588 [Epithele typhae]